MLADAQYRTAESTQELEDAFAELGLSARPGSPEEPTVDLWLSVPGGGDVAVEVKRVSTPGLDAVRGWSGRIRRSREPALLRVLVADRVTQPVRERLRRDGFGWLDLRGHLRLVGGGVFIDSDVTAQRQRPERSGPLAGQAGLEVACWLLMHPTSRPGVREIAAHLGRAPSTVSEILKALRARDLVTSDGLAEPPELFAQVADRWRPSRTHLAALPPVQDPAVSRALGLRHRRP